MASKAKPDMATMTVEQWHTYWAKQKRLIELRNMREMRKQWAEREAAKLAAPASKVGA